MMCPKCGTPHSNVTATRKRPHGVLARRRICYNGHRFTTLEVPPQCVHIRNILAAHREATSKAKLWKRDGIIARDTRPSAQVAADHGISPQRVNDIRRKARKVLEATP